ncbi:hypothetical protein CALVIDRAFT_542977 [Calocera viscosa TUFC12733]|uniref:Uncharacterized protein n=1 Tax=Calocera viscosa (strain TUFC12733) TaxID=1330018 RepID=A0A167G3N9_CALVF|nr:hypothetical protein CALVIDRAFT_542977 [Calocera viscosa TUFC12733]
MARCVWNFAGLSVLLDFGRIHSRNWARLGFSPRVKVMLALTEAATSWAIPVVALRTRWLLEDKPRVMTAIRDMRKESLQYWDAPRAKTPGPQVFEEEVWSGDWPADKTEGDLAASDRRSP